MAHQEPSRKVAMALLAHPDDAEFLCGGTLIRLVDTGWEVHIVTLTAGDCGSATLPAEEISGIRRREGRSAAESIGGSYHCLEELDLNVIYNQATIAKATDIMRRIAPSLVFAHARHDYMMDHEHAHQLARSATFNFSIPNASKLPLVENSTVPWLYYCDPVEALDPYTGEHVTPTTYVDISDQLPRKVDMLACHVSQREWLRSHHGMDEYIDSMKRFGELRGKEIGTSCAEAFLLHRGHAYPHSDLLGELFS